MKASPCKIHTIVVRRREVLVIELVEGHSAFFPKDDVLCKLLNYILRTNERAEPTTTTKYDI